MAIETVDVVSDNLMAWGIQVWDYRIAGKITDFQDLLIKITEQRATTVENEVKPMSTRMDNRNKQLSKLGKALSIVADVQSKFDSDTGETTTKSSTDSLTEDSSAGLEMVGLYVGTSGSLTLTKSQAEYYQQMLKTKIDELNNLANKDMTRLQSLVDKRDESYSTATSLMQSVGDTRANTIKNM